MIIDNKNQKTNCDLMRKDKKKNQEPKLQFSVHILFLIISAMAISSFTSAAHFPQQLILRINNTSFTEGSLNAEINPIAVVCADNPCLVSHNMKVVNSHANGIELALYIKEGEKYMLVTEIGALEPGETAEFSVPLRYYYNGFTTYVGRYALISNDSYVKEFTIVEDWEKYEKSSNETIKIGAYVVAPVIALVLMFILYLVINNAEHRKYGKKDVYTDKTLFEFPYGKTPGEQAANGMANPIIWFFTIFFAVTLACLIAFSAYTEYSLETKIQIILISFVASLIVPLILMILTWYADIYEREPFRFVVGMFVYGIFAAFVTFFLNNVFLYLVHETPELLPLALSTAIISLIASPIIEELLKTFGLAVFSNHPEFDDALDGLLYGFAIGLGFAMYENWFYFLARVDPIITGIDAWLSIIMYRSVFNTISHACFTGFIGLVLGLLKSRPKYKKFYKIGIIPGLFMAMLLHIAFNLTAYLDITNLGEYRTILVSFNPALVVALGIAFAIAYAFASLDTKRQKHIETTQDVSN